MDEWCTKTHGESGLTEKVKSSNISLEQAEDQVLTFLQNECGLKSFTCPLAGNSVGQDRKFIEKDMPKLGKFLHYRTVDVSTVKELVRRWYPEIAAPKKKLCHRALDDILESIEELKFYKNNVF